MTNRFASALVAAGLLGAIAAAPAHADMKVTWHMTIDSPQMRNVPEQYRSMADSFMNPMVISSDGKRTRTDTPMMSTIIDKPADKMIMIMKMNKTYSVSSLAAGKGMPMPGAGAVGNGKPSDVTVTATGKSKTIIGHKCHELIVTGKLEQQQGPNMQFKDDMWVASDLASMTGATSGMPFGSLGSSSSKIDGFPLEMSVALTGGQADGTTVAITTTDLSSDALPAGTFDIPAGYTKTDGPGFGGMGMGGPGMGGPGGFHRGQ